jgi:hypothetical protein
VAEGTVSRAAFSISIAINAAILSLITTAVLVTLFLEPSEESLGFGLIWAASLPLAVFLATLTVFAYPRYVSAPSQWNRISLYSLLVILVAAVSYGITVGILR